MTNSTINVIYKNIKKYRLEKGYSQVEFAEMVGFSVDYISLIENGKRTPSLKSLFKIAEVLGLEVYKLFL